MGRKPLVEASRLPVCRACRGSVVLTEGNLCAICGGRMAAFSRVEAEPESRRDILLVDDPFTTGTTISEFAPGLLRARAASACAAIVARPLKADRIGIQREVREAA